MTIYNGDFPTHAVGCLFSVIFAFSLVGCGVKSKLLVYYNATNQPVEITRIDGVSLYARNRGPQNLGLLNYPQQNSSMHSFALRINYPIQINWVHGEGSEESETIIDRIDGLDEGNQRREGKLLLAFQRKEAGVGEYDWSAFWFEIEGVVAGGYESTPDERLILPDDLRQRFSEQPAKPD